MSSKEGWTPIEVFCGALFIGGMFLCVLTALREIRDDARAFYASQVEAKP